MSLESLVHFDQKLLLFLNGSNSLFCDYMMTGITSTVAWIPVAVILLYVIIKNNSPQKVALIVIFIALSILIADQFTSSFCKPYFQRLRPTHDPAIMHLVDIVNGYRGGRFGFMSSHAANTFAVCVFVSLLVRNVWMTLSMVIWAALCSYSRIYLGVHYPGDILCGGLCGVIIGFVCYGLYTFLLRKMEPSKKFISNQYTSTGYAISDLNVFQITLYLTYVVLIIRAVVIV